MLTACVTSNLEKQYSIRCWNQQHIAIRGDDCHVPIMDIDGNIVRTITTDTENGPSDVVILDEQNIIYIKYYSKHIVFVKNMETTQELKTVTTTDWYPIQLCVSRPSYILVCVCFQEYHDSKDQGRKVLQYTSTGELIREIRYHFNRPLFIAENINSDIIVNDYYSVKTKYLVKAVSSREYLRFIYDGSVEFGFASTVGPGGLDCDTLGHIIIADHYNNNIHIINKDGGFVRFLLNENHYVDKLWGMCFDGVDSIWITELESKKYKQFRYMTVEG
ncbi:uncharacterized protein LOC134233312 [Saccostrea cucullata]|uniref:uncharacterized protein LOC134233312 n=1 Tax=Saccostrea cuccullata TaxID=36930 RepID=UPI002ED3AF48